MSFPSKERFSGSLIGQCLGDALGFPVEGWPPEDCTAYVERELRPVGAAQARRGPFAFGQYTDDSQLARELMQSYAELGRFDPADYAQRINAIFREDRIVGRGMATHAAARNLALGVPWDQAGMPAPNAGNGTAMRAGPVGLLFGESLEQMIQVAHDQGRITHKDPRCSAGSVAIAGAAALAARGGPVDPRAFVGQLSEWMRGFDAGFARDVLRLPEWLPLPPEEAAQLVAQCGPPDYQDGWKWISPFVVSSVLWSLYSFLRTPGDYWETICTAIIVGGDVDTTAAMAGAISGAHLGLEALPLDLAQKLTDQGTWGFSELVELAHRCHALKTGK